MNEVYYNGMIKWVDKLKARNALTEVFNKEQDTQLHIIKTN